MTDLWHDALGEDNPRAMTGAPDTHSPAPERPADPGPVDRVTTRLAGPPPQANGGPWLLAVAVVAIGGFMSVLDTSIVNVAVPVIQKEFGTSADNIQWISTAYSLALGVIVPVSGWLGDRFGLRWIYVASMVGFAAGSILCGIAWDLPSMVMFRIIQAVPGGILPVVSLSILYRVAPKEKIGAAMAIYGLGVVFAPGVGPTLGGYLVEYHVDAHVIPQVGAFSAHVIPQGCAHVIPHREGERVGLGVVLAVGKLLPTQACGPGSLDWRGEPSTWST